MTPTLQRFRTTSTALGISFIALVLAVVGTLCATSPARAEAATLGTDAVSFISVNAIDAVASDPVGSGTLDDPYEGTITTAVGADELAYLSVMFTDGNTEGVATYLVQSATPASESAIDQTMTNVDGRCNSDLSLGSHPGTTMLWVLAKSSPAASTGEVFKIELTITAKTPQPIFSAYTVWAEPDDTTAIFQVVNADDYAGDIAVTLYTSEGGLLGSGYSGVYAGGTLTVTFPRAITGETMLRVKFTAPNEGGSDLTAVMIVYPHATGTPAAPEFESPVMAAQGNMLATIPLTGPAYSGWVEIDVYGDDGFIASGVAPEYDPRTNTITLTFDPALTVATDYRISVKVDQIESEPTALTVLPHEGPANQTVTVYRLYNPSLGGAHLFTADANERSVLTGLGWISEGARFLEYENAESGGVPVNRLYNPNNGDHFFTANANEVRGLVAVGWRDEGPKWYGAPEDALPVHRLYNPNDTYDGGLGNHLWTAQTRENDVLQTIGWLGEGIGWYAVALA